ncbi:aromatic acid exporter family protein [Virgibacillus sp. W0430]|uniref:aromatic acid exporter family protein n=1 Tax=Virgibacillus sp. W0430 TaxID=3391580 RepID=UPI003F44F823
MKRFPFAGTRVVKTGVAIFLTALFCDLLNWPPVFAVITAIVTLEPTVSDSIKKGIIRFPASAIGSAYAVIFIALFGNSPITYTLAAVFTIVTCFKLKLHAGLLVATLTAVAMVEVIHGNYFLAFFIRLGTTTIGLLVSTFVNLLILPPDYMKEIKSNIDTICQSMGNSIKQVFEEKLASNLSHSEQVAKLINELDKKIHRTEALIRFQQDESKLHPFVGSKQVEFKAMQEEIKHLRFMHYHITNLFNTPLAAISFPEKDSKQILGAVNQLAMSMKVNTSFQTVEHEHQLKIVLDLFSKDEDITVSNIHAETLVHPKLIVLYELLSLYNLVRQFYENERIAAS